MSLAQLFSDELISRHQLALDALHRQEPEISATETLATRLRECGIDAKADGKIGEGNRISVRVFAQSDSALVMSVLDSIAVDHELIGHYDPDKHNNPAIDIYKVITSGQEVLLVVQAK